MKKKKEPVQGTRNRVMVLAIIMITIIAIFAGVAVLSGRNKTKEAENTTTHKANEDWDTKDTIATSSIKDTTKESGEETTESKTEEITTLAEDETIAMEDATANEHEGNIDDKVEESEVTVSNTLPYLIKVNRVQNCITIYGKDEDGQYTKPVKAIVCSTGKNLGDTPAGEFRTLISYEWLLMVDGSYGQFAYRFYGSILFHSVPYFSKNKADLEFEQFNKLGEAASLGCVRVCVRDAIWLIENCPVGTDVIVYDDPTSPGPLGKPEMIKIPLDSPYRGWDPTDPDPQNPWHAFDAEIKVKEKAAVTAGKYDMETIVAAIGATAKDTCGNDITQKITASGEVDFDKAGTYTLVLTVKDAIGKTDTKAVTLKVKEKAEKTTTEEKTTEEETEEEKTVTLSVADTKPVIEINQYSSVKKLLAALGCSAEYSDGTTSKNPEKYISVVKGTCDLKKIGTYNIWLKYQDKKGITSNKVRVTIQVYGQPELSAEKVSLEVTAGEYSSEPSSIFTKLVLKAADSRGKAVRNVASMVEYKESIDFNTPGVYTLNLTLTDAYGVTSNTLTITITVVEQETTTEQTTESETDEDESDTADAETESGTETES